MLTLRPVLAAAGLLALLHSAASHAGGVPEVDGREPITREMCEAGSFDYTNRFPAEGQQGAQGQCFAFAAAGIFDEHACMDDSSLCGQRHSPIDIARDYPDKTNGMGEPDLADPWWRRDFFNVANANQGGPVDELISAALDEGVCLEKYAPWFPKLEKRCRTLSDRSACVIEGLKKQWLKYDRIVRKMRPGTDSGDLAAREDAKIAAILSVTSSYLTPQIRDGGLDVQATLESSASEHEFVEKALIPPNCESHRTLLGGEKWHQTWSVTTSLIEVRQKKTADGSTVTSFEDPQLTNKSFGTNPERFDRLTGFARENDRSIALSLCSRMALVPSHKRADDPRDRSVCGPHALVANGVHWNSSKNRCEIHLRNSWGPTTSLRGWVPIEPVLNSTIQISGIDPH